MPLHIVQTRYGTSAFSRFTAETPFSSKICNAAAAFSAFWSGHRPSVSNLYPAIAPLQIDVLERSDEGAVLLSLECRGLLGVGMLVLAGRDAATEQTFCITLQRRTASSCWSLPIPPLEIAARPLAYHLLFQFRGNRREWTSCLAEAAPYLTGVALGCLRPYVPSDGQIRVTNLAQEREMKPLQGHTGDVLSLAASADGGEAVTNALGLPVPCSGNFADVYAWG
ncbi:hypothetical protein AYO44_18370 [Planctomycetaceae bacterium SCGC AG-212-F19]|nr:hypothetical protein AYO44_18370 [Planctomycetaceae bacterium SCGC AG-212-F19]